MLTEEWRPIATLEGCYECSDLGRVRNARTGFVLRAGPNNLGYCHFGARRPDEPKARTFKLHQVIAKAFIPNPNGWPDVNHIDLDKLNNAASNLEWTYDQANQAHAVAGKVYCPAHNPKRRHKLTSDQVREIRALFATNEFTRAALARRFQVHARTIGRVVHVQHWKHVA